MALTDNDRIQEIFLVIGDKLAPVKKIWWYVFGIVLVALIPLYYLARSGFAQLMISRYQAPQITYTSAIKQPLQIIDKKIFTLSENSYSGYIKIKNINLEWGVAAQQYTAEFNTLGGTSITKVNGSAFILPASEKIIVFSRFSSPTKPEEIVAALGSTAFIRKPETVFNFELERVNLQNNPDGLTVSAGIKNLTPFTVKTINLPVTVYNNQNQIVGVNFTNINDVLSGDTRTFTYFWPASVPGASRAEISPEINIFDRNIFSSPPGVSPFSSSTEPAPATQ
jgi:hypothetical protein